MADEGIMILTKLPPHAHQTVPVRRREPVKGISGRYGDLLSQPERTAHQEKVSVFPCWRQRIAHPLPQFPVIVRQRLAAHDHFQSRGRLPPWAGDIPPDKIIAPFRRRMNQPSSGADLRGDLAAGRGLMLFKGCLKGKWRCKDSERIPAFQAENRGRFKD